MYLTIATIGFAGGLICMNLKHIRQQSQILRKHYIPYMNREFIEQVEMTLYHLLPLSLIGVAGILSKVDDVSLYL